jgi:hypothetical protein
MHWRLIPSRLTEQSLTGYLCVLVLGITLALGLWPFHAPSNSVTWLSGVNGLAFGASGVVWSSGMLGAQTKTASAGSIELWAEPDHWSSSATLLSLYKEEGRVLFRLRQSLTDLEVSNGNHAEDRKTAVFVKEAFGPALRRKKRVFITVSSNSGGTGIYLDGVLTKMLPQFRIREGAVEGRLILGGSPWQPDAFRGKIYGVAIYNTKLTDAQVMGHYQAWVKNEFTPSPDEHVLGLFRFEERHGAIVHNEAPGASLLIPDTYAVVDKIALEPFWKEFDFSRSYWSGNVKNLAGLVPLGFIFCAYCFQAGIRRPTLISVAIGTLVSLTIEVFQTFLPTRDSGTTDLFTNALGAYLGTLCYTRVYPLVVLRFPLLSLVCKAAGTAGRFD